MGVYIVLKFEHCDDYKRGGGSSDVEHVFDNEEPAYEYAAINQLGEIKLHDDYDKWKEEIIEIENMQPPWKKIYEKTVELFDQTLPDPKYTVYASQVRYDVVVKPVLHELPPRTMQEP